MAGLPKLRWSTTLRKAEEVVDAVRALLEWTQAASKLEILNGHLITASFVATAAVNVRHQLGRPYKGVIVVSSTDASSTPGVTTLPASALSGTGTGDPSKYVALGATSAFTADLVLWVF